MCVSINTIDLLEFDNSTQLPLSNGLYSDIEMQNNMQTLLGGTDADCLAWEIIIYEIIYFPNSNATHTSE